jgi:hypothetical protein
MADQSEDLDDPTPNSLPLKSLMHRDAHQVDRFNPVQLANNVLQLLDIRHAIVLY